MTTPGLTHRPVEEIRPGDSVVHPATCLVHGIAQTHPAGRSRAHRMLLFTSGGSCTAAPGEQLAAHRPDPEPAIPSGAPRIVPVSVPAGAVRVGDIVQADGMAREVATVAPVDDTTVRLVFHAVLHKTLGRADDVTVYRREAAPHDRQTGPEGAR